MPGRCCRLVLMEIIDGSKITTIQNGLQGRVGHRVYGRVRRRRRVHFYRRHVRKLVAGGKIVTEVDAEASQAGVDFSGKTVPIGSGFVIIWNAGRLKALPPEVHDYLFFHGCAHAGVPTTDELKANCAGLQDMRAAARAGFAVESRLGVFYGPGSDYWTRTLKGADVTARSKPP
jgi:hypothetical protein